MIGIIENRILSRIVVDAETGCWNWTRSLQKNGYGSLSLKRLGLHTAHRAAWFAFKGLVSPHQGEE